jgi:hypothetical protein
MFPHMQDGQKAGVSSITLLKNGAAGPLIFGAAPRTPPAEHATSSLGIGSILPWAYSDNSRTPPLCYSGTRVRFTDGGG